jgi:serine/threonine protein phosphatase PrpC
MMDGKPKPRNQDAFDVSLQFAANQNQHLLTVLDGHGAFGHDVSAWLKDQLHEKIRVDLMRLAAATSDVSAEAIAALKNGILKASLGL